MPLFPKNWKTTISGVVAILTGVIALLQIGLGEQSFEQGWPVAFAAISAGIGLLFSRDINTPGPLDPPPMPPRKG